ncbi:uncharacterized protein LOC127858502 isoform X2 [Dreissena polymorpha]|uniref:uncharacterized protein LOC127858502 isoform X2 n=1 Tax=Dreissena polymorpha TaxID=45954 RepID=UPI0022644861|nr:uncharacterized protein LOC127858502 isoform X2 [Dreissena polymorpha]
MAVNTVLKLTWRYDDETDQEIDQEILDAATRATNELQDGGKADEEDDKEDECLKACADKEGEEKEYCIAVCLVEDDKGLGQRTIEKQRKRGWIRMRRIRIRLPDVIKIAGIVAGVAGR